MLKIYQGEFSRIPLEHREKQSMQCMIKGLSILASTNIKHWISCGTLLGLYRNGIFIPHDLDIDIAVQLDYDIGYKEIENKIYGLFEKSGRRIIRTIHFDDRIFQIAYIDENNVIFDMTMYYTGLKEGKLISISDVGVVEEDINLFKGVIPYPIEDYLAMRYGDWKTPTGSQSPRDTQCACLVDKDVFNYMKSIGR